MLILQEVHLSPRDHVTCCVSRSHAKRCINIHQIALKTSAQANNLQGHSRSLEINKSHAAVFSNNVSILHNFHRVHHHHHHQKHARAWSMAVFKNCLHVQQSGREWTDHYSQQAVGLIPLSTAMLSLVCQVDAGSGGLHEWVQSTCIVCCGLGSQSDQRVGLAEFSLLKVTQGHWYWCHLWFLISLPLHLYLYPNSTYSQYTPILRTLTCIW